MGRASSAAVSELLQAINTGRRILQPAGPAPAGFGIERLLYYVPSFSQVWQFITYIFSSLYQLYKYNLYIILFVFLLLIIVVIVDSKVRPLFTGDWDVLQPWRVIVNQKYIVRALFDYLSALSIFMISLLLLMPIAAFSTKREQIPLFFLTSCYLFLLYELVFSIVRAIVLLIPAHNNLDLGTLYAFRNFTLIWTVSITAPFMFLVPTALPSMVIPTALISINLDILSAKTNQWSTTSMIESLLSRLLIITVAIFTIILLEFS